MVVTKKQIEENIKVSLGNRGKSKKNDEKAWNDVEYCPNCGNKMYYSMTISGGGLGRGKITVNDDQGQPIDTTIKSVALYYCPVCTKFHTLNDMLQP